MTRISSEITSQDWNAHADIRAYKSWADLEELGSQHFLERFVLPREVIGEEYHVGVTVPSNDVALSTAMTIAAATALGRTTNKNASSNPSPRPTAVAARAHLDETLENCGLKNAERISLHVYRGSDKPYSVL